MNAHSEIVVGDLVLFSGLFYKGRAIEMVSEWKRGIVTSVFCEDASPHILILCEREVVKVPLSGGATEIQVVMRERLSSV